MTKSEFEARALPRIEEFLRTMPCFWQGEENCENAWDNLIEIYPDHEPGMGMWDRIQDLIRDWIAGCLEKQPVEDLREYWDERTDHDDYYYENREEVEKHGVAPSYPPLEKVCADIARELLGEILNRAESEGDRRREEKEEFDAMWGDPREVLEMLGVFFEEKRTSVEADDALRDALDQWIHACSVIPFQWPAAAPPLRLDETGAGTLRLRFIYDGTRMELLAALPAIDLFIPSAEWECSFSLSANEVSGTDYNDHTERIATSGPNADHDFVVTLDGPSGRIDRSIKH